MASPPRLLPSVTVCGVAQCFRAIADRAKHDRPDSFTPCGRLSLPCCFQSGRVAGCRSSRRAPWVSAAKDLPACSPLTPRGSEDVRPDAVARGSQGAFRSARPSATWKTPSGGPLVGPQLACCRCSAEAKQLASCFWRIRRRAAAQVSRLAFVLAGGRPASPISPARHSADSERSSKRGSESLGSAS